jgi:LacI family transcriptional regulator
VMVNGFLDGRNIYSILCDDFQGIKDTVAYLVKLGHKDIFYVNDVKSNSGLSKISGFKAGMTEYGLNEANIIAPEAHSENDPSGVRRFLECRPKVTAVITGQDATAITVIKELNAQGYQVPSDVAVVGYNNSVFAQIATPALTSVDNLQEPMAKYAVRILYDVLHGKPAPHKTVLSPSLVVRDSTGLTI